MTRRLTITTLALALAVLCLGIGSATAPAKAAAPTKIGVFDSRAVALAYWRSDVGMRELRALHEEYAKAKAANDETRIKELEQEGPWRQVRMHQQVFSTATAATILEKVSDKLPGVAKEAGVSAIVSKWEVPYKDASIETVDVTLSIVRLFNQDPQTLKMIQEMSAQPPIPFEKLPLDPNM
jgi:Skp family chaperone for outer membrane proteins